MPSSTKNPLRPGASNALTWSSPANIALVKYWGKHGNQLPCNPSISLTLEKARTQMSFWCHQRQGQGAPSLDFTFHQVPKDSFAAKMEKFLQELAKSRPYLNDWHFTIDARNTFPHSTGIASSASSMSAFCLGITSLDYGVKRGGFPPDAKDWPDFWREASSLSRLASGSACRSLYGGVVLWGEVPSVPGSGDEHARALEGLDPVFQKYRDAICVVDSHEKSVSSRQGHGLMGQHPFALARYEQAKKNTLRLLEIMRRGELDDFVDLVEEEALALHAMMMTSSPSYLLMRPRTVRVIEKVRQFRQTSRIPVCFTLDAGPNIHLLYAERDAAAVEKFIAEELVSECEEGRFIADGVGQGPVVWNEGELIGE